MRTGAPQTIHHFGSVEAPAVVAQEKISLYRRLRMEKVACEPENFEAQLQLGITELFQMNRVDEALSFLRRAAL